jgi:hypothetical protein
VGRGVEHITTSYRVLVEALGEPGKGDDGKTMAQWDLNTPHGWAEVYDFKDPAESPVDVEVWHVQAHSEEAFGYVYDRIREAASALGEPEGLGES